MGKRTNEQMNFIGKLTLITFGIMFEILLIYEVVAGDPNSVQAPIYMLGIANIVGLVCIIDAIENNAQGN